MDDPVYTSKLGAARSTTTARLYANAAFSSDLVDPELPAREPSAYEPNDEHSLMNDEIYIETVKGEWESPPRFLSEGVPLTLYRTSLPWTRS